MLVSALAAVVGLGLAACGDNATSSTTAGATGTATSAPTSAPTSGPATPATTSRTAPTTTSPGTRHTKATHTATGTATSKAQPNTTVVKKFNAFDSSGKPAIPIDATRHGYCWTGSIALDAPRAYRCMAHNQILDPCFVPSGGTHSFAVCVEAPWTKGTKLVLNRPLPRSGNTGPARPGWALKLANGDRCVAITGMVPFVDNIPMNYQCTAGGRAGKLRHDSSRWTVAYVGPHAATPHRVVVATAWE